MAINPLSKDNKQSGAAKKIATKVAKRALVPIASGCCCSAGSCLPVFVILFVVFFLVVLFEELKKQIGL